MLYIFSRNSSELILQTEKNLTFRSLQKAGKDTKFDTESQVDTALVLEKRIF